MRNARERPLPSGRVFSNLSLYWRRVAGDPWALAVAPPPSRRHPDRPQRPRVGQRPDAEPLHASAAAGRARTTLGLTCRKLKTLQPRAVEQRRTDSCWRRPTATKRAGMLAAQLMSLPRQSLAEAAAVCDLRGTTVLPRQQLGQPPLRVRVGRAARLRRCRALTPVRGRTGAARTWRDSLEPRLAALATHVVSICEFACVILHVAVW